jgi:DNA-binding transcriptional LysR family regulator
MDDLNLSRLRAFVAVAEDLSFTRAAARLHIAQQALSATILRLERDLGVRLFERSTRSVGLTAAGRAMLDHSRRALHALASGIADARRADRMGRNTLSVGVMAGAALELTDPILAEFARQQPNAVVTLDPHLYDDPSAGLRGATSDVAILRLPLDLRGLEVARLFTEPRVASLSTRHPLATRRALTLADLQATTVVRPMSPDPIWNDFWAADCPTTITARTLEAALEHVSAAKAVAISTAGWARYYPRPGVRSLPVVGLAPSAAVLGRRTAENHPLVRIFVDIALATTLGSPAIRRFIETPPATTEHDPAFDDRLVGG